MKRILIPVISLLVAVSCTPGSSLKNSNDAEFLLTLDQLISGVNALEGYDSDDITAVDRQTLDQARDSWDKFASMCFRGQFRKAYKYMNRGAHYSEFLVHLQHSGYRYAFISQIYLPLIKEFESDEQAVSSYVEKLEAEVAMEETSIMIGDNEYIPEQYTAALIDLGYALYYAGRIEDAVGLTSKLINVAAQMTGSNMYGNFYGTQYLAGLMESNGDLQGALDLYKTFSATVQEALDQTPDDASFKQWLMTSEREVSRLESELDQ